MEAAAVLGPVDASESAVVMSMVREPPMEDDELPTMLTMLGDHDTDLGVGSGVMLRTPALDDAVLEYGLRNLSAMRRLSA